MLYAKHQEQVLVYRGTHYCRHDVDYTRCQGEWQIEWARLVEEG